MRISNILLHITVELLFLKPYCISLFLNVSCFVFSKVLSNMLPNKQLNAIALELADILQYNLIGTTVAFKILVGI